VKEECCGHSSKANRARTGKLRNVLPSSMKSVRLTFAGGRGQASLRFSIWERTHELVPAHLLLYGCPGHLGQALPHTPGLNVKPFSKSSSQASVPKRSCVLRKYFSPYKQGEPEGTARFLIFTPVSQ